jgi:hypothetical protein
VSCSLFTDAVDFPCYYYYDSCTDKCPSTNIVEDDSSKKCIVDECENIVDSTQCAPGGLFSSLVCFWLFSGDMTSGDNGSCVAKNDLTLTCEDAKRLDQCIDTSIDNFGTDCFWLEEQTNLSESGYGAAHCILRVCY